MSAAAVATVLAAPFIGSFARLVADRAPHGEGVIFGRSRCDACGATLAARDLAPLVSYALAQGRARCCGAPLRRALLLAEAAAIGVALWSIAAVDASLVPITAALGWTLLALSLIDIEQYLLPDALTLPLLLAGLCVAIAGYSGPAVTHALGAALGFGGAWAVRAAYRRWRGVEGLGLGDVKLIAAAGAWLGPAGLPSALLIACAAGFALAAAAALEGKGGWRAPVPFGPALALGFFVTWAHGPLNLAIST